jgi:hypothetical protein
MAFLISTPESGVDSISISWALLDPIMTIARPVAAFVSAFIAGSVENFRTLSKVDPIGVTDLSCPVDNCCDGIDCSPEEHQNHHTLAGKMGYGVRYAVTELWGDIAGPFFVGVFLAGIIYVIIPDDFFVAYLGGGLHSMLIMLVLGIPLYICATASTPIAAAFILKGVSPGAALVFLLVGPATNIMSVSVLTSLLGKRATGIYLVSIAMVSVLFGLGLDKVYEFAGLSAQVTIGNAAEIIPVWFKNVSALFLVALSIPLLVKVFRNLFVRRETDCGCAGSSCAIGTNISSKRNEEHVATHGGSEHLHVVAGASAPKDCC